MDEEERTGYGYMKSREYNLAPEEEKARKQMMELILLSSRFASSITVENEEKHFNGKSILKAGELKKGEHFMCWLTAAMPRRQLRHLTSYFRRQREESDRRKL